MPDPYRSGKIRFIARGEGDILGFTAFQTEIYRGGDAKRLQTRGLAAKATASHNIMEVVVLRKLLVAALVLLLAAGASFAYDTKIIDAGTDLNNLHQTIRPISHLLSEDYEVFDRGNSVGGGNRYSPRSIGVGYTVEDEYGKFFDFDEGHRVGVSDTKVTPGYFSDKQKVLGQAGGKALDLQQAESTAVWRAIPMMTGTLMDICGDEEDPIGQAWYEDAKKFFAPDRINVWDLPDRSTYDEPWGVYDRTPTEKPADEETHYGYAVPRIEARNISHALFANPGTNVGTDDDPFTIGQETMTSVFVWSADRIYSTDLDMSGLGGEPDTVAVMVRLDNDLYKGLKASDLNVIKVEANAGDWQGELTQVYSASQLRKNTFAVVLRDTSADRDFVVGPDHVIQAGDRALASDGTICPTDRTCDVEWLWMQYFALVAVKKQDPWDVADARSGFEEVIGGLHIVVGERPFVKTPNLCCGYPDGVEPRFGWVLGNRPNAEQRYDGFTRDPFLADAISGRPANMGVDSGYPDAVLEAMENWNYMHFVTDEVVEAYGFGSAPVFKLPAVRAGSVPAEKTALVMFTIRLGDGEMELPVADFVGKTPADVQVFDVSGPEAGDKVPYELATNYLDLTEGHFAILKPHATNRHEQVIVPADEAFEEGVYFVALAARDNGEFDNDKFNPLSNNQVWFSPAFVVFGAVAPMEPGIVVDGQTTLEVGGYNVLTAYVDMVAALEDGEDEEFEIGYKVIDEDEVIEVVKVEEDEEEVEAAQLSNTIVLGVTGKNVGEATIRFFQVDDEGEEVEGGLEKEVTITVVAPEPGGHGSSGGCSVGFAPAAVLLLAPLFLLKK